ncbi:MULTISPECIES: dihydroneopterin aldolase [Mesoflavibacter]|uniref:7,8-dihydroneopterin aldolase n=2 Tax=Mesoflavibacter TaxID=444051 RepID=A0A2T1N6W4_9FLAO|nr:MULTISPECIES: dihydroneopterin aldolase [Mesoflavibacter]MCP4053547.1 dihydroneopterin aldolase [Mesoflavibacter sp.]MBB3123138.1 dihydroneopterin aldolase [Mesoflavibacter zeaxanthinifaciens subsp. sabulilitoris]MDA0177953.1 dihydroneopterin aldolase [Mesoflavibacter profundi]PSG87220.1 dihydroneopterin aldolase [Mesoflavibacter zeaxanthinifaciens subsp. sabulilitoris]QIJ88913.1 Dihydroneopterin aldolase [Mesoflavibacter sp. HG96]|tara:strand:+ start:711 stop:1082 length:372 start_codon:yes stop_codon:yes gene_type:complete
MGKIKVENIRVFAHHGCLKEETAIGSDYRVDLEITANLQHSAKTDQLKDTVDYVFLNRIIFEEMKVPSALLEHVARRILNRIFTEDQMIKKATVSVSKINPPIGGDVEQVTIVMSDKRKNFKK